MIVRFSPLALRRMKFIGGGWRKNRPAAATLFEDELDEAIHKIASQPSLGVVHEVVGGKTFRRILLRKTKQRVFYFVDEAKGVIVIHTESGALAEDVARSCSFSCCLVGVRRGEGAPPLGHLVHRARRGALAGSASASITPTGETRVGECRLPTQARTSASSPRSSQPPRPSEATGERGRGRAEPRRSGNPRPPWRRGEHVRGGGAPVNSSSAGRAPAARGTAARRTARAAGPRARSPPTRPYGW